MANIEVSQSGDGFQINISGDLAKQFDVEALQRCLSTFASCAATNDDCIGTFTKSFSGFCGQGSAACETASAQLVSSLCGYKGGASDTKSY